MSRFSMLLALVVLLACNACSPAGAREGNIWLEQGSPGRAAQDAWGMALALPTTFESVSHEEIKARCTDEEANPLGCTLIYEDHLVILTDHTLDQKTLDAVLLHEVGHAIRPGLKHLTEGCADDNNASAHVMCAHGRFTSAPSEGDFDWALTPE